MSIKLKLKYKTKLSLNSNLKSRNCGSISIIVKKEIQNRIKKEKEKKMWGRKDRPWFGPSGHFGPPRPRLRPACAPDLGPQWSHLRARVTWHVGLLTLEPVT